MRTTTEPSYFDIRVPDVHARPLFGWTSYECAVMLTPFTLLLVATILAFKQPTSPVMSTVRLGLLPVGIFTTLKAATFRTVAPSPEFAPYDYAVGMVAFWVGMKLLEATYLQKRPTRITHRKSPQSNSGERQGAAKANGHTSVGVPPLTGGALVSESIRFICDLRLVSYDVGVPAGFFPPETRDVNNRKSFLHDTLRSTATRYLLFDFLQTMLRCIPNTTLGTPQGGTIFLPNLPPVTQYAVSTLISVLTCLAIFTGMGCAHDLCTIVSVGLLNQDPIEHPPLFWRPWGATSLRMFWSKGWHSFFRRTFWVTGGIPGKYIAGNAGVVIGVFLVSGLLHDVGIWGMGKGCDHIRIVGFFVLQAFGMVGESVWRSLTGKKVSGVYGWIWTMTFLCTTGNIVTEAWLQRGVAGGSYFLADIWCPTRWIVRYVNPR